MYFLIITRIKGGVKQMARAGPGMQGSCLLSMAAETPEQPLLSRFLWESFAHSSNSIHNQEIVS